jgi:hypothetical protein
MRIIMGIAIYLIIVFPLAVFLGRRLRKMQQFYPPAVPRNSRDGKKEEP